MCGRNLSNPAPLVASAVDVSLRPTPKPPAALGKKPQVPRLFDFYLQLLLPFFNGASR